MLPEKIVLLIDRQDTYLKSFYYPNVFHIYDNKLNFGNAFSMIKNNENFNKNTLFVMLCGTMSALKQEINQECHLFLCKELLYNYFLQDFKAPSLHEHLVSEAKALRERIATLENCNIIFAGLLPVKIERAEAYEAERHYNQTGHKVRVNSNKCEDLYSGLCAELNKFNKWAKEDAELLGFPNWSLVDAYTVDASSAPENNNQLCADLREDVNISNDSWSKPIATDSGTSQHPESVIKDKSIPLRGSRSLSEDSGTHTTENNSNPTNPSDINSSLNSPTDSLTTHQPFSHPTEANGVTLTMKCMLKRLDTLKKEVEKTFLLVKKLKRKQKPPKDPEVQLLLYDHSAFIAS